MRLTFAAVDRGLHQCHLLTAGVSQLRMSLWQLRGAVNASAKARCSLLIDRPRPSGRDDE
jgi:hypothetical protein